MARKKTGRLTHWGCWNYPLPALRRASAQEYIDAYDADPMTHCETCRKKAVWYDREKERFLADETERLAAQVAEEV